MNPLWVMGYDNFPLTSVAQKERWLADAHSRGWWLSFYHDLLCWPAKVDAAAAVAHVPRRVWGSRRRWM